MFKCIWLMICELGWYFIITIVYIYIYDLKWYRCNLKGKTWFENIMQGIIIVIIKEKLLSWKYNLLSGLFLFCDTKVILKTSIVK